MPFGGLLTVAIIGAGTSLYAAHKQSSSAKDAANIQAQSGDKALALQGQIYNQTRNDLAPYRGAGTAALGSEMSLLGLNPAAMGSLGGGPSGVDGSASTANTPWGGTVLDDGQRGSITDPSIQPDASQGSTGFIGNLSQSQRAQDPSTTSSYSTPGQHGSSVNVPKVTMRAPDGSTQVVSADQVPYYQQKGAIVVGGANG